MRGASFGQPLYLEGGGTVDAVAAQASAERRSRCAMRKRSKRNNRSDCRPWAVARVLRPRLSSRMSR